MFNIFDYIQQLKRVINRHDVLIIISLVFLYFVTRLININEYPIFSDEGIYVHWAKIAWHDASWRFISLTDGRQPLQTWATIPLLKLFPNQALFAGRLFAVFSGLFSLAGLVVTGWYLWGKRTAYVAGLLYIIIPYFLFYDRIALVDSFVNGAAIWIFFLAIILARTVRLDVALILGLFAGMFLLAKSSVRIFVGMGLFAGLFLLDSKKRFFDFLKINRVKETYIKLFNFVVLYGIAVVIALALYNIQRLSPHFHFVALKNTTFVVTQAEFLNAPFALLPHNLKMIPFYLFSESAYIMPLAGLLGLYFLFKKDKRLGLYFLVWILGPYLMIGFVTKIFYPRHVIFFSSLLVLLTAYLITEVLDRKKALIMGIAIALSVIYFDYALLFDFAKTPFPQVDRGQYIEGWPAGWGTREIVTFAREKSTEKPVTLIAEGNYGMSGDVLDTHLVPGDKIDIKGYWPLDLPQLQENQALLKDHFVYVVFSHRREFPQDWPIQLIRKYDKPGDESEIYLYELTK